MNKIGKPGGLGKGKIGEISKLGKMPVCVKLDSLRSLDNKGDVG